MVIKNTKNFAGRLWDDRRGQDVVEYVLIIGLVAIIANAILSEVVQNAPDIFRKLGFGEWSLGAATSYTDNPVLRVIRIIFAVIAVLFLYLIVLRRKMDAE